MLIVIQPLKKYLTEHESETLSTCHDKYLASCQDAQRPPSKTASLPEGKCILLLYFVLLSTVYILPMAIIQTGVLFHPTSYAFPFSMPTAPGDDPWWHIEYAWTEQLSGKLKSCPTFLSDASADTHCLLADS